MPRCRSCSVLIWRSAALWSGTTPAVWCVLPVDGMVTAVTPNFIDTVPPVRAGALARDIIQRWANNRIMSVRDVAATQNRRWPPSTFLSNDGRRRGGGGPVTSAQATSGSSAHQAPGRPTMIATALKICPHGFPPPGVGDHAVEPVPALCSGPQPMLFFCRKSPDQTG
jgi:hypothetical protein